MLTLACTEGEFYGHLVDLFLIMVLVKPITYFAFISAFRFRTSNDAPLSWKRVLGLTALRTILGVVLVATTFRYIAGPLEELIDKDVAGWIALGFERTFVWLGIGWFGAKLHGRRLVGWTGSGVLIDLGYDWIIDAGVFDTSWHHATFAVGLIVFLVALAAIGRRRSLRDRYAPYRCKGCGYDLRGLSEALCPECGGGAKVGG